MKLADFLDDQGKWYCIECGDCCRLASLLVPDWDRGDGTCIWLNAKSRCTVYEKRPEVCRTKEHNTSLEKAEACLSITRFVGEAQ